ncbi:MAG: hypothetical protein OK455_09890 [Thaumarchaeota archaeon]|nr:hypothetical protein [Nitrososphaerota archaeon]
MLVPTLSVTFLVAALVPLVLGFLVGMVIKTALKIGLIIAIIILIMIGLGILAPSQVLTPIVGAFKNGGALTSKVMQVAGYLPYSSITFLIGAAVGFLKG